ncbi:MAG: NAD(P)/FAD-dependent oxidoreductase [Gemmatimonadota bacterium]
MSRGNVTVIGSGPNGLAAAVAMARRGHPVTVLEARDTIGGGTRTEELTLPGFLHDVCSAVHPMAVSSPFFRELPLAEHGLTWVHPPVLAAHPFDDGSAAVLMRSTADTGASLGVDARAYQALMDPFVENWQAIFQHGMGPPLRLPRHPVTLARFGALGVRSALGLAHSRFEGPRARALLVGICAHVLLPMNRSPSAAFGLMLALAGHGAGWPIPRGGSRAITDALARLLRTHGGSIETGVEVRDIDVHPARRAAITFMDLTPRQVLAVAGHRLPGRYRRHLERFRYAPGVFKMDWALSEPIPWTADACRRAGTLHLGGSAEAIARSSDAAWRGEHAAEPLVILAQPTLFDPSRAPAGRHVAWAYCHVPHGSTRDMTRAVERQVERFAPGFRDIVLARSTRDTRQMEAHNPNLVGGDISGGAQDLTQLLFRPAPRLDPYATPVDGLYICSASTPPGGGVHGMCGYHAARSALRRL